MNQRKNVGISYVVEDVYLKSRNANVALFCHHKMFILILIEVVFLQWCSYLSYSMSELGSSKGRAHRRDWRHEVSTGRIRKCNVALKDKSILSTPSAVKWTHRNAKMSWGISKVLLHVKNVSPFQRRILIKMYAQFESRKVTQAKKKVGLQSKQQNWTEPLIPKV